MAQATWSSGEAFSDLERFLHRLVHVSAENCSFEGVMRICDTARGQLIVERYCRVTDPLRGYWEEFPGNQRHAIKLHIPLAPAPPGEAEYVTVPGPERVLLLGADELVAEAIMDEETGIPPPPQQLVPVSCVFHYRSVATLLAAVYANNLAVVHLSYGHQELVCESDPELLEYVNSQASRGLEGRVLEITTVQTLAAAHVMVKLEVWERVEYGHTYVRRPESPLVVHVAAPHECRTLRRVGDADLYVL